MSDYRLHERLVSGQGGQHGHDFGTAGENPPPSSHPPADYYTDLTKEWTPPSSHPHPSSK